MDIKAAVLASIDRIPDTEEGNAALRKLYAIAKKAGKETRCAPKRRKLEAHLYDMREEMIGIMIRDRAAR